MPLAFVDTQAIYFAHIPKCGGTSVERYLRHKGRVFLVSPNRTRLSRTTPQHVPARIAANWVPAELTDHRFTVVREPVGRLVSAFRYKARPAPCPEPRKGQRLLSGRKDGRVDPNRRCFEIRFRREPQVLSFDEWVDMTFAACEKTPWIYDNHLLPQVEFLEPDAKVFSLHDGLDQVFDWIDAVTGTEASPREHANKSESFAVDMSLETFERIVSFYQGDYAALAPYGVTRPEPVLIDSNRIMY